MHLLNANTVFVRSALACAALLACVVSGSAAYAQATLSEQRLDRLDVIGPASATNIAMDAAENWVKADYGVTPGAGAAFTTCQNTSTRGLYCLVGNSIKRWANPETSAGGVELFNCGINVNGVFGFDKDNVCTAMAVDLAGNIWIAGKKKTKFSLFKVVPGTCTAAMTVAGWAQFSTPTGGSFCAREFASGRPLLIDLSVIDGDVAAAFPYPIEDGIDGGVIAVEERKEVTFFPDVPQGIPVKIGDGKTLGLAGGEQLQAASLLQKAQPVQNWLLVTTSAGRVLSREVSSGQKGSPISVSSTSCGQTALYDIVTSVKTGATFVSDRRGCRVLSLKSSLNVDGKLVFDLPQPIASSDPLSPLADLREAPQGLSIAPGIEVDLRTECSGLQECGIVPDGTDNGTVPAASLTKVQLDASGPSGLTVFQIRNIPDCRYLPYGAPLECQSAILAPPDLTHPNSRVIAYPGDYDTTTGLPLNPHTLFLNVTPLMPPEVTKVAVLPVMLISPRYRALNGTFDALFGVTDDGVLFRKTFIGNFDLGDLLGRKLGCGGTKATDPPLGPDNLPLWPAEGPRWDVILTISERHTTVGGLPGGGRQNTEMLVNTYGCDPNDPPISGSRWSLYAYGLKLANPNGPTGLYPDSIFARLVLSLFSDLGATINDYLCPVDGPALVSASTCSILLGPTGAWANTFDKLTKCVESSTEPMNSTGIRTCQGFDTQYLSFKSLIDGLAPAPVPAPGIPDPANRVGEVQQRLEVFRYVYDEQYIKSLLPEGFHDGL